MENKENNTSDYINELLTLISNNYKAWDKIDDNSETTVRTGYINDKFYCRVSIKSIL